MPADIQDIGPDLFRTVDVDLKNIASDQVPGLELPGGLDMGHHHFPIRQQAHLDLAGRLQILFDDGLLGFNFLFLLLAVGHVVDDHKNHVTLAELNRSGRELQIFRHRMAVNIESPVHAPALDRRPGCH